MKSKKSRKEILNLEKQMQKNPLPEIVLSLADKYIEVEEPHQAVAVLLEGIPIFPESYELQIQCAKLMLRFQTDDVARAESMVKNILLNNPENADAQMLMQIIHSQVDTMYEVARQTDTRELEAQPTMQIESESSHDVPVFHKQLTEGFSKYHSGNMKEALEIFQEILENDPENADAREGFRLAYASQLNETEDVELSSKLERKMLVVKRSIDFLEAMRTVVVQKGKTSE